MLRQSKENRTNSTAAALADLRMKSEIKAFSKIDITFFLFFHPFTFLLLFSLLSVYV
jgi:hypothetical protein